MKKLITSAFMALGFLGLQAQDLPKIIPPSPNAAGLAQYVDVPVSHYTGLPSINIPLYTVSSDGMQVPVGLSYHARGIPLAQIASSYGMGWSMNAGGIVTRQIRGNADDSGVGYLKQNHWDTFFGLDTASEATRLSVRNLSVNNDFDFTPDQFMFNFAGYSGKFIYDRDTNEPILQSFDDLKIETVGNLTGSILNIEGFIITDTKGVKYYFGRRKNGTGDSNGDEITDKNHTLMNYTYTGVMSSDYNGSIGKNTSWYLLEIINPVGKKISFTYDTETSDVYRKTEEVSELPGPQLPFVKTARFSQIRMNQKRIKKIAFESGEVNFNYGFNRYDIPAYNGTIAKALSSVEVLNNYGDRVKKYVFDYAHTTSTETANILPVLRDQAAAKKRLFLNSVKQEGDGGLFLPPHKFTYNPTVMPSRHSTSHDKWGYYNGKNNGNFAVFGDNLTQIAGTVIDTVKVQAGLLTKIEYPTGGWSEYEYESNRAIFPEHLKDHVAFTQNNPISNKSVSIDKDVIYYDAPTKTYSIPFTVGPNLVVSNANGAGTIFTTVFLDNPACNTNVQTIDCPYRIQIHNADGTLYAILHKTSTSVSIFPGDYTLRAISNLNLEDPYDNMSNSFGVQLEWKESVENEEYIIYTGGNRIKKTTLYEGNGQAIVKNYEYKDDSGISSGRVFSLPSYYGASSITIAGGVTLRVLQHVTFRPANILTLEQGNHGGYSHVTEYIGNQNNNIGKTEYKFTTHYDGGLYYRLPFHLPADNEWLRGKLTEVRSYKNDQGNYSLVAKTKNIYEYAGMEGENENIIYPSIFGGTSLNNKVQNFVKLARFNSALQSPLGQFDPLTAHNKYTVYYLNAGTLKLKKTKSTQYYESEEVSNIKEYFYNYDKHYQTKYTQTINSKGETSFSEIIYPQDKVNPTIYEQKLDTLHQFFPLEVNTYRGYINQPNGVIALHPSMTLSKTKTEYIEPFIDIVVPERVKTAKGASSLEERITYHSYYSNGKVKEVSKADGTHIVYLWGYNNTLPIAKIENATFNDIPSNIYHEIWGTSNSEMSSTTENTLRAKLAKLRDVTESPNLSNALVTSYTYDPLIGVTSITDPRGQTIYYEYDIFKRLKQVKDVDGKILSHNEYHYKE